MEAFREKFGRVRRVRSLRWLVLSFAGAAVYTGCGSVPRSSAGDPAQVIDGSRQYVGPAIGHRIASGRHIFIVNTPTGGWDVRLDREELVGSEGRVFLTMVRPGPDEMVTQAFVAHRVETDLPSDRAVGLYARVLERERSSGESGFALVRRVEP